MIFSRKIGSAEFLSLGIASADRSIEQLGAVFPDIARESLSDAISPDETVTWSFTMPLIRLGGKSVLVDTGFSFADGSAGASTQSLLAEAGVDAADIDVVVITHAHGDHIGGLLHDGRPAFQHAELVIHDAELSFWSGPAGEEFYDADAVAPAREAFAAYRDRTRPLTDGGVVVDNGGGDLRLVHIPGHTPGHIGLELQSEGATITMLTDTLHTELQLNHLEWSPRFDVDPTLAALQRKSQVGLVEESNTLTHFYHLPFPGIGHIRRDRDALRWVPIDH